VDGDAPGARLEKAGDQAQHRRLAGATRAEDGEELAAFDGEAGIVDGRHGAEALGDAVEADHRRLAGHTGSSKRPGLTTAATCQNAG
jgi:hypothetical protein